MTAVTRSELMLLLSERIPGISAKTADEAVRLILEEMTHAVSSGRRIEIRGFGSFALNYRPARKGRNPRSGESVEVPAKYAVHFKGRQGNARSRRPSGEGRRPDRFPGRD